MKIMSEPDREGRSPLHYAAAQDDASAILEGLANGEDPSAGDRSGFTPLHFAALEGSVHAAEVLLAHGASVDAVNRYGNTPLFVAVFNCKGEGDMITILRRHGADPMVENHGGQSPLGLSRLIGNYDVAQFFGDLPDSQDA